MPSARLKPAIPAMQRPQTDALDRKETGIGELTNYNPTKERMRDGRGWHMRSESTQKQLL